jgi:hypothetical protein
VGHLPTALLPPHLPAYSILGFPTQQTPSLAPSTDNQLTAELANLKSTITVLSKTVSDLQPKVKGAKTPVTQPTPPTGKPGTQGKGFDHVNSPTHASKAVAKGRPSLILDLGVTNQENQLAFEMVTYLNNELHVQGYENIKLSVMRWTSKRNIRVRSAYFLSRATPAKFSKLLRVQKSAGE